jgi:hypothetical protein
MRTKIFIPLAALCAISTSAWAVAERHWCDYGDGFAGLHHERNDALAQSCGEHLRPRMDDLGHSACGRSCDCHW